MRITLTITNSEAQGDDQDLLTLDVFPEMTIETLRNSIQVETGHDSSAQHLYHNGHLISENSKTLADLQIGDGEMLALHIREMRGSTTEAGPATRQPGQPRARNNTQQDPEMVRLQILGNPGMRNELARTQPQMRCWNRKHHWSRALGPGEDWQPVPALQLHSHGRQAGRAFAGSGYA
ncbi:hypothetical protein V8F20_007053 [Naviculisporaceae sp. PSN 640]